MSPRRSAANRAAAPEEYCATLVLRSAASKHDALAVVALVAESPVVAPRTLHPRVELADAAWVEVELPKTGEPPPLALDVYSTVSEDHAQLHALTLLERLSASTAWNVRPDFEV